MSALVKIRSERHSALKHLLDRVFLLLCDADGQRRARLQETMARIQPLLES